ncbi:MAG TPA: aspartate/glutamate racemase family protein, partial [Candidatus Limnocylindria bacterium]|nr:aspartate/glutamate racemase family protein [Candidatus Limnocylindria bacterium]
FEARVHRVCQRLVAQHWNAGYPPMVVWYHRRLPVRVGDDGVPLVPRQVDPQLVEAAAWLGRVADFLVIPCNTAHIGLREITEAAGRPVLSMIDVTLDEIARRRFTRVGVLGFSGASPLYLEPLRARGVHCETIEAAAQARLDGAIRAVMEGSDGKDESAAALAAVAGVRSRASEGVVLGCTEIPLLLHEDATAPDLIDPAALLAEAAVRFAMA